MFKNLLAAFFCCLAVCSMAQAKELTNRLGVGIKNDSSMNLPELAAVYYVLPDIAVVGGLGIDTQKDESKFSFNGGVRRIVFKEENMNFYMGGNVGYVNYETPTTSNSSGLELSGVFGGEFFLPGLDSLAFTFEGGVGVITANEVRFRTIADDPFKAGIIFYF